MTKTTCPFCLYGCELGIVSEPVSRIEYLPLSKINQGRLCARGNAAPIILSHKMRLAYPLHQNKEVFWDKAIPQIPNSESQIPNSDYSLGGQEIAITFDQGLTKEEFNLVNKFAAELQGTSGLGGFACSYLEPDLLLQGCLDDIQIAQIQDIEKTNIFILVGDVFGQTPVIAKPILERRYAERNNRIFVIDSIQTRTAAFADKFLRCAPSTEPLILLGLIALLNGKLTESAKGGLLKAIAEVTECPISEISAVGGQVSALGGLVVSATCLGRTEDPYLLSLTCQTLAVKGKMKYLPTGEYLPFGIGKDSFGDILYRIKQGRIKVLINFGENFPFHYPQIQADLGKLDHLIATALFRPTPLPIPNLTILPIPSNLEKQGTIKTLWGEAKINKTMEPVSGSKTIPQIIDYLRQSIQRGFAPLNPRKDFFLKPGEMRGLPSSVDRDRGPLTDNGQRKTDNPPKADEVYQRAEEFLNKKLHEKNRNPNLVTLIGSKPAIGFLNIFDDEVIIKINPADALRFKLDDKKPVKVAAESALCGYETELIAKVTEEVPPGVAQVGVNRIENRRLFHIVIDKATNNVIFTPTEVRLWQKESS
jgi:anaerobic selenocysteine-containing dehydrogenase